MKRMNITGLLVKTWLKNHLMPLIILIIILMEFIGFFILEKNFYDEQAANTPPAIKEYQDIEKMLARERGLGYHFFGGGEGRQATLVDRINHELLVLNHNRLTELNTAIERFNKTSTILSKAMVVLSIFMANLVLFQIYLKVRDKKNQTPPPMRLTYF